MNKKLLEQLALAKQAGTKSMAKQFFAPVPGGAEEDAQDGGADDALEGAPGEGGGDMAGGEPGGELTPDKLEELLRLLGQSGGEQ